MLYNSGALLESGSDSGRAEEQLGASRKVFWKRWKKRLTNAKRCDIIIKPLNGRATKRAAGKRDGPWKLNNERTLLIASKSLQKRLRENSSPKEIGRKNGNEPENILSGFRTRKRHEICCGRFRIFQRVWSWLRMNAGGVLNTCKSNGRRELAPEVSGGRVSNVWATCPSEGDNSWKRLLIPHNMWESHDFCIKGVIRWKMGSYLIR